MSEVSLVVLKESFWKLPPPELCLCPQLGSGFLQSIQMTQVAKGLMSVWSAPALKENGGHQIDRMVTPVDKKIKEIAGLSSQGWG